MVPDAASTAANTRANRLALPCLRTWQRADQHDMPVQGLAENGGDMLTRDDIIRMAREAGFHAWYSDPEREYHFGCAMKFAALVAAAERERLKWDSIHSCGNDCQRPACVQGREQRARIYEECAQAVAVFDKTFQTGGVIAHAIRARSK
jgi:hypothetical protein